MSQNDLLQTSFGVSRGGVQVTSLLKFIVLTYFYVACELYQPLGKTEFSSVAKTEQTLSHR